jgi:hypothetical protein
VATLLNAPPDATISFPITKMEETADGDLLIYGKATDGSVDSDDQIVDAEWSGKALQDWLRTGGNVRVQHSPNLYPAGRGVEVDVAQDGSHWVKSLIVEDTAKKLVKKGVLRAYSVGIAKPRIIRDAHARGGRIVDGQIAELSLVDRPANKNCGFTLCKSVGDDGHPEVVNKMFGDTDLVEKAGPKGYEHGWIYVGGAGGAKIPRFSHGSGDKPDFVKPGTVKNPKFKEGDAVHRKDAVLSNGTAGFGANLHVNGAPMNHELGTKYPVYDSHTKTQGHLFGHELGQGHKPVQKGAPVTTVAPEETVTATVTFTPKDLAMILGKGKKPDSVDGEAANPTNAGGGPKDDDAMADKIDTGGGKETATASAPYHTDLDENDKGRLGKTARATSADMDDDAKTRAEDATQSNPDPTEDDASADDEFPDGDEDDGAKKGTGPFAVEKRDFSKDQREQAADSGAAMPDGSFPIKNAGDLSNAIGLAGNGKNPGAARAHIKRRAAALGLSDKIPDTWKVQDAVVEKQDVDDAGVTKAGKVPCPSCGKKVKPTAKFCPKCGGKMAEADVTKGQTTQDPAAAAGARAKKTDPAPTGDKEGKVIREVPGEGNDWSTTPSGKTTNEGTSLKFDGPWEMKRLHDLTCAAFSTKALNEEYAALPSFGHAVDVSYWRNEAMKSVSSGDLEEAASALQRAQAADMLKSGDVDTVTEAHADLHKSFTDMYPDVPEPTPTELDPGRYTRPYLQAGHARETLAPHGSQPPKPRAHEIEAQQFQRGPLTGGHARNSPASKGSNAGAPGGMSAGVYYGNAARAQAANAMISLHDHVAGVWPQLCPMNAGTPVRAVGKANVTETDTVTKTANDSEYTLEVDPWYAEQGLVTKAVTTTTDGNGTNAMLPDVIKAALSEALTERDEQIKALQGRIDELEHLPNPHEAAYRGPGLVSKMSRTAIDDEIDAAGPRSIITKAAQQRDNDMLGYLQDRQTYAPSPAEREQARVALNELYQKYNAG